MQTSNKPIAVFLISVCLLIFSACGKDKAVVIGSSQNNTSTFDLGRLQNECSGRRGRVYQHGENHYCQYPVKTMENRECYRAYLNPNTYILTDFSRITDVRGGDLIEVQSVSNDVTFRISIDGMNINQGRDAAFVAQNDGYLFARDNSFQHYYSGKYCLSRLIISRCEDFQGKTYNCRR